MLHFRSHTIADVLLVEILVPAICDGPEIDEMSEELHELIGRSPSKKMIIDLARVRFIASRALSLLLSLRRLVDIHHGELMLCNLRQELRQIFRISGQDRFLSVQPSRDHALAALGVAAARSGSDSSCLTFSI